MGDLELGSCGCGGVDVWRRVMCGCVGVEWEAGEVVHYARVRFWKSQSLHFADYVACTILEVAESSFYRLCRV